MAVGGCLRIQYTGAQASCLLEADAVAKTLTSRIGAAGAEAADPAFGTAGVIDLTAATADTLQELSALIDAYADYTCSILYGDNIPTSNVLDSTAQAKGDPASILFIITSVLSATALTTWARTKLYLSLEDSEQLLTEYILNSIEPMAERIAARKFAARALTKDLDGSGRDSLILPVFPINSVTRVSVDSNGLFPASCDLAATDYVIYSEQGIIRLRSDCFDEGVQNVRVIWNGGFTPIPEDLQLAAIECVSWNRKRLTGSNIGVRSIMSGDMNTSMEITIPLSAQRTFESYRVVA